MSDTAHFNVADFSSKISGHGLASPNKDSPDFDLQSSPTPLPKY